MEGKFLFYTPLKDMYFLFDPNIDFHRTEFRFNWQEKRMRNEKLFSSSGPSFL